MSAARRRKRGVNPPAAAGGEGGKGRRREAERSGGDRGSAVAEHRRRSRACPWRQCACCRSAVSTAVRRRVARTVGRGRSARCACDGAQWSRAERGLSPLLLRLRAEMGGNPERTEARRGPCGRARRSGDGARSVTATPARFLPLAKAKHQNGKYGWAVYDATYR